jgi:hypothetical protein
MRNIAHPTHQTSANTRTLKTSFARNGAIAVGGTIATSNIHIAINFTKRDRTFHSGKKSIMSSCVQAKPLASPMVIACPRIPPNTDPVIDITKYGVGSHSKRMSTIA